MRALVIHDSGEHMLNLLKANCMLQQITWLTYEFGWWSVHNETSATVSLTL